MPEQHLYSVSTSHGDVSFKTSSHHSTFRTIEDFIKAHSAVIQAGLGVAGVGISVLGLYLTHGKGKVKLA